MIFAVSIIAIFAGVSIYFFFRAERLQREILIIKREEKLTIKENKALHNALAITLSQYEETVKERYFLLKNSMASSSKKLESLAVVFPLVNNFSNIAQEALKGKKQLSIIVKKCYLTIDANAYVEFSNHMKLQDKRVQRFWSNNNLKGFLMLVDALLGEYEKSEFNEVSKKAS